MARILILVVLLIVYGSLYPWQFTARDLPASPLWILFHTWDGGFNRFALRDAIVNVTLYLPLGMAGYLALQGRKRIWLPLAGGFALSCTMEIIQLFERTRHTSALDVVTNVTGTIGGILLGTIFEKMAASAKDRFSRRQVADRAALSLLFVWAGYLVFPLFPLVGFFGPRQKLRVFLGAPLIALVPLLSAMAVWFAGGKLMRASGVNAVPRWLAILLLVIPLQFFIVDRQPVPSDIAGAVAGFLLIVWLGNTPKVHLAEALSFLFVILLRGFAPFRFGPALRSFSWLPFGGFLGTSWQSGILILLEKTFYYGTAIWLFHIAGMRLWRATALVAAALAVIEVAQIYLPGRTPEITDPVMAILMGFGLRAVWRDTRRAG